MVKIFKPRRGKKSTMAGIRKSVVLDKGEMHIEVPDSGVGTGHCRMKMGDGVTTYEHLPYAMGDTQNDKIGFANNTDSNIDNVLNSIESEKPLSELIGALKQAISLNKESVNDLNTECSKMREDFQDGCKKISDALAAAGVTSSGTDLNTIIQNIETLKNQSYNNGYNEGVNDTKVGTATSSQVLSDYTFTNNNGIGLQGSMPNRGNLNWSGSNTTYSIPSGYYSGGTLDSRTSYMNGYNSGYDKGKKEGGSSVVNGVEYKQSLIELPYKPSGFKTYADNQQYSNSPIETYTEAYRLLLPKSNPSKVCITVYNPDGQTIRYKYSESFGSGGASKNPVFESTIFCSSYKSHSGYGGGSNFRIEYASVELTPNGSWKTIVTGNGQNNAYAALEYRLENGNQLVFRSHIHSTLNMSTVYDSGGITLLFSTADSSGPYGSTIKGKKNYVTVICS